MLLQIAVQHPDLLGHRSCTVELERMSDFRGHLQLEALDLPLAFRGKAGRQSTIGNPKQAFDKGRSKREVHRPILPPSGYDPKHWWSAIVGETEAVVA
jgi:hypothetical protein